MYHNEDSAPRCAELLLSERGVIPHQLPSGPVHHLPLAHCRRLLMLPCIRL